MRSANRTAIAIALAFGLGLSACGNPEQEASDAAADSDPWNLIVVTLDTTRADALSPYGEDPNTTPNLQLFAERSTLFRRAYSETNITNPSHLTLFSGQRAVEHGVLNNGSRVPANVDTLPEALKRKGYRTAGFPAIAHLGRQMGWRGFDHLASAEPAPDARRVTDAALAWLGQESDAPSFAWVHYYDPHTMYAPPRGIAETFYPGDPRAGDGPLVIDHEYFERGAERSPIVRSMREWLTGVRDARYPRAMYAAEVNYVDQQLGRLFDSLEESGTAERTIVVIVADHGESLGEHGIFYAHRGLYETQLHIPFLIHVPGLGAADVNDFVSTLDLIPTLDELMGLGMRASAAPEDSSAAVGRSLVPLLGNAQGTLPELELFVHQNASNHVVAVRQGGWKLLWPVTQDHWLLAGEPQLFHIAEDPAEENDLAAEEPERVQELRALAEPWIRLGTLPSHGAVELPEAALEQLRGLGYLDD